MPATRACAAALAALVLLAGCGQGASGPAAKASDQADPDKATGDCRAQWKTLGEQVGDKADRTNPSALPERWTTVAATVDYYATSGTAKDCGQRLSDQKAAITALTGFETRLHAYDVPYRAAQVRSAATAYAARKAAPKGKPKPAVVAAAMRTLTSQAATATQQQGPAWQQAEVVDLGDQAAVTKAVKDLAFLSSESAAYRACAQALGIVKVATGQG